MRVDSYATRKQIVVTADTPAEFYQLLDVLMNIKHLVHRRKD